MTATQTLDAKAQKSDGPNGHRFAPEMETNNKVPQKRNGRKPQKEVHEQAVTASPAEALPTPVTPESGTILTAGSSELPLQSTAEANTPVFVPTLIVEAKPQQTDRTPPEDQAQPQGTGQQQSNQSAGTDTLTPVVIAQFAHEADVRFFQDQHGNVFAWVRVQAEGQEHFECLGIKSRTFLARLLELIKQRTERMPQLSVLKQAIEILQLEAYRAPKQKLDNRRAVNDDEVFIDLGDEDWSMIRLNRDGWQVTQQDEPRFFRPQHMQALPQPQRNGNLDELFTFLPTEKTEKDGDKLLLTAWLLGGLFARIPNPILLIVGQ